MKLEELVDRYTDLVKKYQYEAELLEYEDAQAIALRARSRELIAVLFDLSVLEV